MHLCDLPHKEDTKKLYSSDEYISPQNASCILNDDKFLFTRVNNETVELREASLEKINKELIVFLLKKAISILPRIDPYDGESLWVDKDLYLKVSSSTPPTNCENKVNISKG